MSFGGVFFFSSVLKLGRWRQSQLGSHLEHLSLFTVVDRVSDDGWLWLRWERCWGGQEVRGLFCDPWPGVLEQDAELQIISYVASPVAD